MLCSRDLGSRSKNYNVTPVLKQAAAVTAASLNWDHCVMITPMSWKAIANRLGGWEKRDDIDAVYMGYAAIAFANGYRSEGWKKEAQVAFLEELAEEYNWTRGDWNGDNNSRSSIEVGTQEEEGDPQ